MTHKNYGMSKSSDPHYNGSGLARLLETYGVKYRGCVGSGLFIFRPRNSLTDHLVRCAFLDVTNELLQLLAPGQFAELDRAVDR